jgi:hypothetical protein
MKREESAEVVVGLSLLQERLYPVDIGENAVHLSRWAVLATGSPTHRRASPARRHPLENRAFRGNRHG